MPKYNGVTYVPYIGGRGEDRCRRIRLDLGVEYDLVSQGADPNILYDIGDQDPREVMKKFFASIPKKDGKEK